VRVVILTSIRRGYASTCLPVLCSSPRIEVARVVLSAAAAPGGGHGLRRQLRKARKIGPFGALNGLRLRGWYAHKGVEDIADVAGRHGVPLVETETVNSRGTRDAFGEADADLGLSLGNGYIESSVFTLPRHGMVNVHNELLPEFQGAQSIIWPIHEGVEETGFTIHQIDEHIDTGEILYQERLPIRFDPTLRETVERNLEESRARVPEAMRLVCEDYEQLKARAIRQKRGKSYTTPTIRQFLRMRKNHAQMYRRATAL
jgi:methionyl-tRNA formyltransferase